MSDDLQEIERALQALQLQSANSSTNAAESVATLAEGSRMYPDIRHQLADPETLRKLVEIVECSVNDDVNTTSLALRCICNACIDNLDARDAICTIGFAWAHRCLLCWQDEEVQWLTVKVLYNICSDHEAAQIQCFHDRLHFPLITICTSPPTLQRDNRSLLIDLLFWITGQRAEHPPSVAEALPETVMDGLLMLPYFHASSTDVEDFATLVEICLSFLRDPSIQKQVVGRKRVAYMWEILQEAANRLGEASTGAEELLKPLPASIIWCLSDISADTAFSHQYGLGHPFIDGLLQVVKSGGKELLSPETIYATSIPEDRSYTAAGEKGSCLYLSGACQVLGNFVRSLPLEDAAQLTEAGALHVPLWNFILTQPLSSDEEVMHSAAGLLIQLTRPSTHVRELMGQDENASVALTALCEHKTPQIQQMGLKLLRALGKECPLNQERFGGLAAHFTNGAAEDAPMTNGS